MAKDGHISMVYANDTVDFGTIDFRESSDGALATKKDDTTHIGSDSDTGHERDDDGDDDDDDVQNKSHRPQHSNYMSSSTNSEFYEHQHILDYLNNAADPSIIDNRKLLYVPIRLACGICAYCSPDVLKHCPMVLRSIQADLSKAFSILPVSVHSLLRRTNLWLNYNGYTFGPKANPRVLRHITTHHHPAWLVEWACDTPQKAIGIEIYSCLDFQNMRLHWNGSGLLIHEFCHLIHQCCLEGGLENKALEDLYEIANASGRYDKVLRRDWAGKTTTITTTAASTTSDIRANDLEGEPNNSEQEKPADFDLAYAMVDKKEFFAELSVAYFCKAYRSLDKQDPNVMEACSPPLLHRGATERVELLVLQRQRARTIRRDNYTENVYHFLEDNEYQSIGNDDDNNNTYYSPKDRSCCWAPFQPLARFVKIAGRRLPFLSINNNNNNNNQIDDEEDPQLSQWSKLINPVFRKRAASRNCANISHCNKFYPFTRGQLKHHDPELFENLRDLWKEISMWEDPFASVRTKNIMSWSCSRRCPNPFFMDC